ncbi:hypothetical protein [Mycobacteroides abscessus]
MTTGESLPGDQPQDDSDGELAAALAGERWFIAGSRTWRISAGEVADAVLADLFVVLREHGVLEEVPMTAWAADRVADVLGQPIPDGFPAPVVKVAGASGTVACWLPQTVRNHLAGGSHSKPPAPAQRAAHGIELPESPVDAPAAQIADGPGVAPPPPPSPQDTGLGAKVWVQGKYAWTDLDASPVNGKVRLATSLGVVTPSGMVEFPAMSEPRHLQVLAVKTGWTLPPKPPREHPYLRPQIWITDEALNAVGFTDEYLAEKGVTDDPDKLLAAVAEFFGVEGKFSKSGWFTLRFPLDPKVKGGAVREVDVVLIPFMDQDPSAARPGDRGLLGIEGTETFVFNAKNEHEMVHKIADNIIWVHTHENAMPSYRWTQVGAQIAAATWERAQPKTKSGIKIEPKGFVLPDEIRGLGTQWWPESWVNEHAPAAQLGWLEVESDQQSAYLPSATGAYLGYGDPEWVEELNPTQFGLEDSGNDYVVSKITVAAGNEIDGLHPELPLPLPAMRWDKATTFWGTTADITQLLIPVDKGGAGLSSGGFELGRSLVWPEKHTWWRMWGELMRDSLKAARENNRPEYEAMAKAIITSFLGRSRAVGKTGWPFPWEAFTQPAWQATIESLTRRRAMKHAVTVFRNTGLVPHHVRADAWFYRIPPEVDPQILASPVRVKDGKEMPRNNGDYRIKGAPVIDLSQLNKKPITRSKRRRSAQQ